MWFLQANDGGVTTEAVDKISLETIDRKLLYRDALAIYSIYLLDSSITLNSSTEVVILSNRFIISGQDFCGQSSGTRWSNQASLPDSNKLEWEIVHEKFWGLNDLGLIRTDGGLQVHTSWDATLVKDSPPPPPNITAVTSIKQLIDRNLSENVYQWVRPRPSM